CRVRWRAVMNAVLALATEQSGSLPAHSRIAVIVNGAARRSREVWQPAVAAVLSRRLRPVFLYPATKEETARQIAGCTMTGFVAVVAAGGDGTVNTLVNAMKGVELPLALLPLGTANDLAREFDLPLDPVAAAGCMTDGAEVRHVDVLEVNGARFCTVGGIGL